MKSCVGTRVLIVVAVLFVNFKLTGQESNSLELLPESDEVRYWILTDKPELFEGDDLYDHINGGADIYHEYGFEEVAVGRYKNQNGNQILTEIYKMTDDGAAYGIYSVSRGEAGEELNAGDGGSFHQYYAVFWRGPYFVSLSSLDTLEEIKSAMILMAKLIDDRIEGNGTKPGLIKLLPEKGLQSVNYYKGHLGFNRLNSSFNGKIFGIKEGVAGHYGDHHVFIFWYPNMAISKHWFTNSRYKLNRRDRLKIFDEHVEHYFAEDSRGNFFHFRTHQNYIYVLIGNSQIKDSDILNNIRKTVEDRKITFLLPTDDELKNLKLKETPKVYKQDELFYFINGGADIFLEYGFNEALSATYSAKKDIEIRLEVFNMESSSAAFGIYSLKREASAPPFMIGNGGVFNDYYLMFWEHHYLVRISSSQQPVIERELLVELGKVVSENIIEQETELKMAGLLPEEGLRENSTVYFKGPIALSNIYRFGAGLFQVEQGIYGEYEDHKIMILRFPSILEMGSQYRLAKAKMQEMSSFSEFQDHKSAFSVVDRKEEPVYIKPAGDYLLICIGKEMKKARKIIDTLWSELKD